MRIIGRAEIIYVYVQEFISVIFGIFSSSLEFVWYVCPPWESKIPEFLPPVLGTSQNSDTWVSYLVWYLVRDGLPLMSWIHVYDTEVVAWPCLLPLIVLSLHLKVDIYFLLQNFNSDCQCQLERSGCRVGPFFNLILTVWDQTEISPSFLLIDNTLSYIPVSYRIFLLFFFFFKIYLTGCSRSPLQHVESFRCGIWDLVPWTGIEPRTPQLWEHHVLATGPPEKSSGFSFLYICLASSLSRWEYGGKTTKI